MKTKIIILAAMSASLAMCEEEFHPVKDYAKYTIESLNPLPLQAAVCDIIGIGKLESRTSTGALIRVSQYWFGNQQTNIIDANVDNDYIPAGGTNFLFFLARPVAMTNEYGLPISRRPFMFKMEEARRFQVPNSRPFLFGGARALIPVVSENTEIINWSSNLVHTAQVNPDLYAFYELVRDGYRLNPASSRIHRDSVWTFCMYDTFFLTTNLIERIWADTNLTGWARGGARNTYWKKTGQMLDDPYPDHDKRMKKNV